MLLRIALAVLGLVWGGCQHDAAVPQRTGHEASFSELWDTYRHCQKSQDPQEMKVDALHLDQTVQKLGDEKNALLVPDTLEQLVLDRPTRLAVDPKAMAASCALLAGYQARETGKPQLAAEMFGHILSNYSINRYRYYVMQAYHGLKGIAGGEQFLPKQFLPPGFDPGS
ncbi:MAG TPA: hypothetical protein VHF07_01435 [Nitrospiraceae bacterium]|nr:hypothetical protein [Nitrospiraceae bacterium]